MAKKISKLFLLSPLLTAPIFPNFMHWFSD